MVDMIDVPFSRDAEQAVIGAVLLDPESIDRITALTPEDFYASDHREIYGAMVRLSADGKRADLLAVDEALAGRAGGFAYLAEISANSIGSANIEAYARMVRDKSIERALLAAGDNIVVMARDRGTSTAEKVDRAQSSIMAISEVKQTREPMLMGEVMAEVIAQIESAVDGVVAIEPTGFPDLDGKAGIRRKHNLVILAGRPAMGKTTLAMNIARNVANFGSSVLVCSMEMGRASVGMRDLSALSRIPHERLERGQLADDEWSRMTVALGKIQETKLVIDDQAALSIMDLRAKCRQTKRRHGLDMLVVDYLQLMVAEGDNRTQQVGAISRGLKQIAKDFDIPVLALSQLNRGLEARANKRPVMSDLRESGEIEQDADIVLFVYRDEVYNPDTHDRGVAEVIVGKNRFGDVGMVPMSFFGEICRFDSFSGALPSATVQERRGSRPMFGGE